MMMLGEKKLKKKSNAKSLLTPSSSRGSNNTLKRNICASKSVGSSSSIDRTPKRKSSNNKERRGASTEDPLLQKRQSRQQLLRKSKGSQQSKQHKYQQNEQEENDEIYREPVTKVIKPENQLVLTDEDLNADVSRILTGDDPNVPKNICKFSYKDKCFKLDPPGLSDQMAVHFVVDGCSLHVESAGYKKQKEIDETKRKFDQENGRALGKQIGSNDQVGNVVGSGNEIDSKIDTSISATMVDNSKNQFNFSDRATQTLNNKLKSRYVCTEPPPVAQYNENVSQWQIYDSYINEYMITNMEHSDQHCSFIRNNDDQAENDAMQSNEMSAALKIIERVVNQNSQDEIYNDFKYWEDESDPYRKGEGSFLPLWRFAYERTKRKQVTALSWNPGNPDLFAVGYGSYDFMQQSSGMICCYTLKNTSFPEYIYCTDSGVLSLDFHMQHPSLLAVGCYDGNVTVFDVSKNTTGSLYSSSVLTGHHSDPVWQISWQREEIGKDLNFYSISSDGAVVNWSLSKNDLQMEPVLQLKLDSSLKEEKEDSVITGLAGGCCFDFSEKQNHLFLVGTEEGNIHKCSKSYSGQYIQTYEGHQMAIYAVRWNPFHEETFISCSADWTIKVSVLLHNLCSFDRYGTETKS